MSLDLRHDRLGLAEATNGVVSPAMFVDESSRKNEYGCRVRYPGRDREDVKIIFRTIAAKDGGLDLSDPLAGLCHMIQCIIYGTVCKVDQMASF